MVRAGVVSHPGEWPYNGYCEIQSPPPRYAVIDRKALTELLGADDFEQCCQIHKGRVYDALKSVQLQRDLMWSQNLAVGHKDYVENIKTALVITVHSRSVIEDSGAYALKEPAVPYTAYLEGEKSLLSA